MSNNSNDDYGADASISTTPQHTAVVWTAISMSIIFTSICVIMKAAFLVIGMQGTHFVFPPLIFMRMQKKLLNQMLYVIAQLFLTICIFILFGISLRLY